MRVEQRSNTITHWECPKCGRVGAKGHPHTPTWSPEYERSPQACDGEPIQRTYIAVDALPIDLLRRAAHHLRNLPVSKESDDTRLAAELEAAADALSGGGDRV